MNYLNGVRSTPLDAFLEDVEAALGARLAPSPAVPGGGGLLGAAGRQLVLAGGAKRARPVIALLVGTGLGALPERLVDLAAATELIHGASLLHDDVVDAGTLRRGLPTANVRHGNGLAVLAGDWVLARALVTLQTYPHVLTDLAVELVTAMSEGAAAELDCRGDATLSVADWRWLARRKCGLLFGFTARAAALIARRPELAGQLEEAFIELGVAFQMADDVKDALDEAAGKDRFADVRNRNPSWALAVQSAAAPAFRAALTAAWLAPAPDEAQVQELGRQLNASRDSLLAALDAELRCAVERAAGLLGPAGATLTSFAGLIWGRLPRRTEEGRAVA